MIYLNYCCTYSLIITTIQCIIKLRSIFSLLLYSKYVTNKDEYLIFQVDKYLNDESPCIFNL
jgi:hypothetical protein